MIDHGEYWAPNATVTLYRVPWDSGYENVIDWKTLDRDGWFAAQTDKYEFDSPAAYHRTGTTLRVDLPYPEAYGWNYVHVHNGDIADTSKVPTDFYYFIQNAEMTNPAVTTFFLALDVWTTYLPSTTLVGGYMTRTHLPMVDLDANDDSNIPRALNTYFSQSEGIDVGSEFQTYGVEQARFDDARTYENVDYDDFSDVNYVALITSTAELRSNFGTVSNPNLQTAHGAHAEGLASGASVYAVNLSRLHDLMTYLADYSWVSQCIIGITIVPSAFVDLSGIEQGINTVGSSDVHIADLGNIKGEATAVAKIAMDKVMNEGWTDATSKYKDLRKLWTYPYSVVALDNFCGNVLALKPQLFTTNDSDVDVMSMGMPPFTRAAVFPWGYGGQNDGMVHVSKPSGTGSEFDQHEYELPIGDALQTALWYTDFPQVSLVNNGYLAYMARNANTIQWRYDAANWGFESAKMNANLANQIATTNLESTEMGQRASMMGLDEGAQVQWNSSMLDTAVNAVGAGASLATGAMIGAAGGPVGAVAGAGISAATSLVGGIASGFKGLNTAVKNEDVISATQDYYDQILDAGRYNKKRSYDNAMDVARGNKDNAIQGIQASVKDAAITQPSISGQMGGNGFMFSWGLLFCLWIRYERVSDDAIIRSGQFFRRFGYRVNRYMRFPDHLNVCRYFTYYKVQDMDIPKSQADEETRGIIRNIFTTGATVWGNPWDIGNVDIADNVPDHSNDGRYYG